MPNSQSLPVDACVGEMSAYWSKPTRRSSDRHSSGIFRCAPGSWHRPARQVCPL